MTPDQLEKMVAALLRRSGCRYADQVGGSYDDGIDVIGTTRDNRAVLAQCKHYKSRKVSPKEVREFAGAAAAHPGAVRLFVTSSEFTEHAALTAQRAGIEAINIVQLLRWANRIWTPPLGG